MTAKEKILVYLKDFLLAVAAGVCIGVGGIAFLSCTDKVAGALFFSVGLFAVVYFGLNLYTGKVCYTLKNPPKYIVKLAVILAGNILGAFCLGKLVALTRLNVSLYYRCAEIVAVKLNGGLESAFILGVLCNVLIYLAVDGYSRAEHGAVKIFALVIGVSVFVLAGFEHCVANAFYFAFAGVKAGDCALFMLVNVAGNTAGGVLFPLLCDFCKNAKDKKDKEKKDTPAA